MLEKFSKPCVGSNSLGYTFETCHEVILHVAMGVSMLCWEKSQHIKQTDWVKQHKAKLIAIIISHWEGSCSEC